MFSLALIVLMAGVAASAPPVDTAAQVVARTLLKPILIVKQIYDNNFDGTFTSEFEADNGITSQTSGQLKVFSPKEQGQIMQGQYSYIAPDGTLIVTKWYADERGFHAEGSHIPTPPPVPEAVARTVALLESLPPQPAPVRERR